MTLMRAEIVSIPERIAVQLDTALDSYLAAGARIRDLAPRCLVTLARGSSDHAATYFAYLTGIATGLPVASMGPSIASVHGADLALEGVPVIAVSQSGASPDLARFMRAAIRGGAVGIALTNDPGSPLAAVSDRVLDMAVGPERSVAATKTHIASLTALAGILAGWTGDASLLTALRDLPGQMRRALACDWAPALAAFRPGGTVYVTARGPALAIAGEAALKLKETCRLHAESFSAAELRHGPMALAGADHCVLAFLPREAGADSVADAVARLRAAGSRVFVACGQGAGADRLPTVPATDPLLDPVLQILSFYGFAEQLSRSLGCDPDAPRHLTKVTVTL